MESLGGKSSSSSISISSDNNISKQRKRKHTSEGVDYISNLPKTILFYILSFLTLKDCIVMSSLSRQWKDLWTHIPQLNFSELEFIAIMAKRYIHCPQSSEVPSPHNHSQCLQHSVNVVRRKFVEFVDRTLRLHSGCTLNNFRLFFHSDAHAEWTYKIDSWVRFAMTRNIKELELDFSEGRAFRPIGLAQSYELPSCNFAPKILQTLILNCCKFRTSSFRMFASLQSVSLIQVEVLDCSIGDLTSICPVLEDLSLEYCVLPKVFLVCKHDMKIKRLSVIYCITNEQTMVPIDISTPELLTLKIVGINLMKTSVRKALNLVDAILDIRQQVADSLRRNLLGSLLTNLNPCRALYLTTWCIQVLPMGKNLLQQLPAPLHNLNHLRLGVALVKQELPGISCLLRSCPNLEILTLDMSEPLNVGWDMYQDTIPNIYDFEEYSYWESQTLPYHCLQNCLKKVEIKCFMGKSNEMQMVQFLLKSASVLENFAIYSIKPKTFIPRTLHEQINFMWFQDYNFRKLLNFPRASSQAKIQIFRAANAKFNRMY